MRWKPCSEQQLGVLSLPLDLYPLYTPSLRYLQAHQGLAPPGW